MYIVYRVIVVPYSGKVWWGKGLMYLQYWQGKYVRMMGNQLRKLSVVLFGKPCMYDLLKPNFLAVP